MSTQHQKMIASIKRRDEYYSQAASARQAIMDCLETSANIITAEIRKGTDLEMDRISLPRELEWIKQYKKDNATIISKDGQVYVQLDYGDKKYDISIKAEFINGTEQDIAYATRQVIYAANIARGERQIERLKSSQEQAERKIAELTEQIEKDRERQQQWEKWLEEVKTARTEDRVSTE